jgi:hypothetical protein
MNWVRLLLAVDSEVICFCGEKLGEVLTKSPVPFSFHPKNA